jgi:hypothetical protein
LNKSNPRVIVSHPRCLGQTLGRAAAAGRTGSGVAAAALVLGLGAAVAGVVGGGCAVPGWRAAGTRCAARGGRSAADGVGVVSGEEGLAGLRLVVVLQLKFLEEQIGASRHEGVRLGGEDLLDVAEARTQAAEEIEHLTGLRNWMADVAKVVGELLQIVAAVGDGEFALNNAAELGLEEDRALQFIVTEDALDVRPDGERGGFRLVDEIEDALGDSGIDPIDDTAIDLAPLGVVVVNQRRSADMADEAELPKNGIEEASPLAVVGFREVKENGNVVTDVHRLDHGKLGGLRRIEKGIRCVGVRRGGWRVRHGDGGTEAEAERMVWRVRHGDSGTKAEAERIVW